MNVTDVSRQTAPRKNVSLYVKSLALQKATINNAVCFAFITCL